MQNELITSIVDLLLERSKHFEAAYAADYQQNISEIFPVLQKLTTGVDVNVKFHNLHAFEVPTLCLPLWQMILTTTNQIISAQRS
jgi:hypothetical protein